MKTITAMLLCALLAGCAPAFTDEQVKAVAKNCSEQGMLIQVSHSGGSTSMKCVPKATKSD
jgi:hypothetical protein